jgi:AmmeMemoRadiSam system protein A
MNSLHPALILEDSYDASERRCMLVLARAELRNILSGDPTEFGPELLPCRLWERRGCFVTLTREGMLRGCVGQFASAAPLHEAITHHVQQAALEDPRFPPVQPTELDFLRIEISVVTEPVHAQFSSAEELLQNLNPATDGVLMQIADRTAVFLPQVWSQVSQKEDFLQRLAVKAGLPSSGWRNPRASFSLFRAESFAEPEPAVWCPLVKVV